jgi:hypothetical protein
MFDIKKAYDPKKEKVIGTGRVLPYSKFREGISRIKSEAKRS